jgi:hypothetical protein
MEKKSIAFFMYVYFLFFGVLFIYNLLIIKYYFILDTKKSDYDYYLILLYQAFNATEETEKAVTYENLRLLQISNTISDVELEELEDISIPWSAPTSREYKIMFIYLLSS